MKNLQDQLEVMGEKDLIKAIELSNKIKSKLQLKSDLAQQIQTLISTEKLIEKKLTEIRIKSHLSYKIGNFIVKLKSISDFIKLPYRIIRAYQNHNSNLSLHHNHHEKSYETIKIKEIQPNQDKHSPLAIKIKRKLIKHIDKNKNIVVNKENILRLVFSEIHNMKLKEAWNIGITIAIQLDQIEDFITYFIDRIQKAPKEEIAPIAIEILEMSLFSNNEKAIVTTLVKLKEIAKSENIKERANLAARSLPLFICYLQEENIVNKIEETFDVHIERVGDTDYFVKSFYKQPLALINFLPTNFEEILKSRIKNFEAIYAKLIYHIMAKKKVDEYTVSLFFTLKEKYKPGIIMLLRRENVDNVEIEPTKNIIAKIKSNNDLIFSAMLGIIPLDTICEIISDKKSDFHHDAIGYSLSKFGRNTFILDEFNVDYKSKGLTELGTPEHNDNLIFLYREVNNLPRIKSNSEYNISVIITTHNPDIDYLAEAINSIIFQNKVNVEIILIDDHSKNTSDINNLAKKYSQVKLFKNKSNMGVYASRNYALDLCSFDLITFQDDDDISHPDRLFYQCSTLEKESVEVIAVSHVRFDEMARVQIDSGCKIRSDGPVTMLFRKSLIDKIGKFSPVRSRGDVEFRARIVRNLGEEAYLQDSTPLYFSKGSMNTLSSIFEYGKDHPKLTLQRKIIEVKNEQK